MGVMASGAARVILIVIAVVAVLVALIWVFQRRLIYFPDATPVPPASQLLPGAEDVILTTSDGLELGAWYVPSSAGDRAVTVLVANGNGGNRASRAPLAAELAAVGFHVLLFDYRGYGGNPGSPSSAGLFRDAVAARDYLVRERGATPARMLYFGESLGAGVVTALADAHAPAGLLLRSPFVSLAAIGRHHYPIIPVGWLLRDEFAVAELISGVDVPTTVVFGGADRIVPPEQSLEVAAAAAGPVEVVELAGAGHNDAVMFTGAELIGAVVDLADRSVPADEP
jgi:uncharacterized protein